MKTLEVVNKISYFWRHFFQPPRPLQKFSGWPKSVGCAKFEIYLRTLKNYHLIQLIDGGANGRLFVKIRKKRQLRSKLCHSRKSGRRAEGSLTSVALFSGKYLFVNLEADVRRSVFYSAANGNAIEFGERSEVLSLGERIEIENTAQGMGDEASAMGTRSNGAEFEWATR